MLVKKTNLQRGFVVVEFLVGLVVGLLLIGGIYLWQNSATLTSTSLKVSPATEPAQTDEPAVTLTPDLTVGWKTYTNAQYGFRLKYPQYLALTEKENGYFYISDNLGRVEFGKSFYLSHSVYNMDLPDLKEWVVAHGPRGKGGEDGSNYFPSARNVRVAERNGYRVVEFDDSVPGWSIDTYDVVFQLSESAHVFTLVPARSSDREIFNQILSTFQVLD